MPLSEAVADKCGWRGVRTVPSVRPVPQVVVESFSFGRRVPSALGCVLMLDLRYQLLFPHRKFAGTTWSEGELVQETLALPGVHTVVERTVEDALALVLLNIERDIPTRILVGCRCGQRRSVVLAEVIADTVTARGRKAIAKHHHLNSTVTGGQ
ncbi:hypothetical protein ACH4U6_35660 [Streptomyces netropsis]|uniref:RapZ C-terminal domain-containing protein n=1 Tax=Streptomyces netropsis TaxID=55404 RepID=UPI0037A5F6AA